MKTKLFHHLELFRNMKANILRAAKDWTRYYVKHEQQSFNLEMLISLLPGHMM